MPESPKLSEVTTDPNAPDPWPALRESAVNLAGFLRGLAATHRHVFSDGEREVLRDAAAFIARSIGRPDLAPAVAEIAAARPKEVPLA